MKILAWADSPTADTGFGTVTRNLLGRWKEAGHEVAILGINEYGLDPRKLSEYDYPIYPCQMGSPEQVYGIRRLWPIVQQEKPDILFLLNDPWIIQSAWELPERQVAGKFKTVAYYPTDAPPLKPSWMKTLNELEAQVCYSKYAENVVTTSNGGKIPDNLYQIYHGVDTNIFFPVSQQLARQRLGLPIDTFIVGMVARNQPRKRFDTLMMAFAEFAKGKDNVKLYLHTTLHDIGFDILDLARQLDIESKLILTEDVTPNKGVEPERLNLIYNAFDVNCLISLGDGFGLPVAESMAVGCPQLVSAHSCLQELVDGHGGLTAKTIQYIANAGGMNTWGGLTSVDDIVIKLNRLYENPDLRLRLGEEGYNFIKQSQFTWDFAAEEFMKIFKKIYHILDVGKEER